MKLFFSIFFYCWTLGITGQTLIKKIKTKNFIGTWCCLEKLSDFKQKPAITFFKNPAQHFKDSSSEIFDIYSSESMQIIQRNLDSLRTDTFSAEWFFVKESANLKIVEKIKSNRLILMDGKSDKEILETLQNADPYIHIISVFHLEELYDNKMILKFVSVQQY